MKRIVEKCNTFFRLASKETARLPAEYEKPLLELISKKQERVNADLCELPEEIIESELKLVASGGKLVSFHSLVLSDKFHKEIFDFTVDVAKELNLSFLEDDFIYKTDLGRHIIFYNSNNPDSFNTAHITKWAKKESDHIYPQIKWIIFGIIAGYEVHEIKQFLSSNEGAETANEKIAQYFPASLSKLFHL